MNSLRSILGHFSLAKNAAKAEEKEKPKLRFNASGKFKIVQFTDLHFGHSTEEKDTRTQKLIRDIIEWEKPELAVVTGDVISGNKWDKRTIGWAEKQYRKMTEVMTQCKQYWAFTAGNHDCEADLDREQLS